MAETLTIESPRWNEFAETLNQTVLAQRCRLDHQHAIRIMAEMGDIDIKASVEYFASRGGFCDCEILMNVAFDLFTPEEIQAADEWARRQINGDAA